MRLLGLLTIMLAHASPPNWLFQLRNFGTPLLIVASGLTYSRIYKDKGMDIYAFYKKRVSRLIVPAWMFLSFFFALVYVVSFMVGARYPFSFMDMATTYTFYDGIGFVWVLKIYIILALITPLALTINATVQSNTKYLAMLAAAYGLYEACVFVLEPRLMGHVKELFNNAVFSTIPYAILYLYGHRLARLDKRVVLTACLCALAIFFGMLAIKYRQVGYIVGTQDFKYPPTLYYLSYAFFALNAIYLALSRVDLSTFRYAPVIIWLSSNSLWIYLWHILAFYICYFLHFDPKGDFVLFSIKAAFLLAFGITCTAIQKRAVSSYIPGNSSFQRSMVSYLN